MCKEIFSVIRKANYIAQTITGARSVDYSLNILFIATYVLQFHKNDKITKQTPYRLTPTHVPNYRKRIWDSLNIGVGYGKITLL